MSESKKDRQNLEDFGAFRGLVYALPVSLGIWGATLIPQFYSNVRHTEYRAAVAVVHAPGKLLRAATGGFKSTSAHSYKLGG